VDNECVTLVEDPVTQAVRHSINVSLYPLAEWIAFNWWLLGWDGRRDAGRARLDRRNMRSAGDGFQWPDLTFSGSGDSVRLTWHATPFSRPESLTYLQSGSRWLPRSVVLEALQGVVRSVLSRLTEAQIDKTPLHEEWMRLAALDEDESEFCEASARLGLDPFSEGVDLAEDLERVVSELDPSVVRDFLDVSPTDELRPAAKWVSHSLQSVRQASPPSSASLPDAYAAIPTQPDRHSAPWSIGYDAARLVRAELSLATTDVLDDLPVAVTVSSASREFHIGAVGSRLDGGAAIALPREPRLSGARFSQARSIWHARSAASFLLTASDEWNQQAGRAFAAELLAPAQGIRELLGRRQLPASQDEIEPIADHFRVSDLVISHQLDNQLSDGPID
jgi:hypothetical protein